MKNTAICLAAALATVSTANVASAKSYDCEMSAPLALYRDGEAATLKRIEFPQLSAEAWKFHVQVKAGKKDQPDSAVVTWQGNPIQIAGEYPVLPTAKGAIAFAAYGFGGCIFTEDACVATVQIVDQGVGKAKIVVLPSALWTDRAADSRDPFVAIVEGSCTWKAA
ncbi:MAG: hypothetical protein ACREBO_04140 [Novosphingobium sp.]